MRKSCMLFILAVFTLGILISSQSSWYERFVLKDLFKISSKLPLTVRNRGVNMKMLPEQGSSFTNTEKNKTMFSSHTSMLQGKRKYQPPTKRVWNRRVKNTLTLSKVIENLPEYNNSFRNPCWYDTYKGMTSLKCLPYFYLAGFPKCGTTDLFHRIAAHPLVIAGLKKGTHYFSRLYFDMHRRPCNSEFNCPSANFYDKFFKTASQMIALTGDAQAINSTFLQNGNNNSPSKVQVAFLKAFPRESVDIWKEGQKVNKFPGILADGSPSTSWDFQNFRFITENDGCDYPRNFTADWIRHIYPDTKIIMSMRDPVTRAFSDHLMYESFKGLKVTPSVKVFHGLVEKTIQKLQECLERQTAQILCTTYEYRVRLHPGLYYFYIKAWLEKFPKEQMLFLKFEEYAVNIPETLAKVYKFLGLPPISKEGLDFIGQVQTMHVGNYTGLQMLNKTRKLLTNFYKPFNEKLVALLGDDKFLWN